MRGIDAPGEGPTNTPCQNPTENHQYKCPKEAAAAPVRQQNQRQPRGCLQANKQPGEDPGPPYEQEEIAPASIRGLDHPPQQTELTAAPHTKKGERCKTVHEVEEKRNHGVTDYDARFGQKKFSGSLTNHS
jgi:hypothetical protein